ncbi:hypothetical protein B0W44_15650 [Novibacillus thermophilus]|uniref:Uncharacterized protein n=1 Tax=Novibacillus thermophilus TaxID=1471761 RepID=A0A1U9KAA7_9BACL|nr:hypothetical protein B0W44_15650 [Novibacillus thermophilus]
MCQETKDEHNLAVVYISYGEVYYQTKDYEKALEFTNKATDLVKNFHFTYEYLQLLLVKAHISLGIHSEHILNICQEAIQLAEKTKLYNKKKDFHMVLAKYYDRCGNKEHFLRETENLFRVERLLQGEE